ncbi:DUF4810 domain-containing protein [Desulfobacter hydrogenophilus]|uniref:DUF4810 domain-containing protein n=1 Tax=Desulfobacter hydrogenophilus TaxID=2291 RepID=A0A328FH24_9BACT|nr:DUF4810 domain-containing protein [Desulfobacter hydrogenophilus]NDY72282.1 DUF4810 domain-containing protein [Desulfobacter hydrogenophilus]QBH12909.1 DUF4810 domain-containing protein [Desulfobacter hydrogenophilus]RAM03894.1 DUF4810 domain-containing protein [Desulfobacter hydrogenophilus]
MNMNKWCALPLLIIFLMAGCATNKEIYYWGEYEQLIHDAYIKPGSADPATQIEKLNADIQKSEAMGKRVAPGIYAHLGFLYAVEGKDSQSKAAFKQEQTLYPESNAFIEGMLNRARQNEENQL